MFKENFADPRPILMSFDFRKAIMTECWKEEPSKRPDFRQIRLQLENGVKTDPVRNPGEKTDNLIFVCPIAACRNTLMGLTAHNWQK